MVAASPPSGAAARREPDCKRGFSGGGRVPGCPLGEHGPGSGLLVGFGGKVYPRVVITVVVVVAAVGCQTRYLPAGWPPMPSGAAARRGVAAGLLGQGDGGAGLATTCIGTSRAECHRRALLVGGGRRWRWWWQQWQPWPPEPAGGLTLEDGARVV